MRFTISSTSERHKEACTCAVASLHGEILSAGDDYAVWRWNANGEPIAKVGDFEACPTIIRWVPTMGGVKRAGSKEGTNELCLIGFADGTMKLVNTASGRVEKSIDAHVGAVSGIAFAPDGSSIATAGEDGVIKIWSQAGIQRSVLASVGKCVYALVWGAENTEMQGGCLLYAVGNDVIVKPLNPSVKRQIKWRAHSGVVLCADWSRMSNYVITGGEDGLFKVWDPYGRIIFTSNAIDYPITSIGFAPDGELFAVGSFTQLRICDKTGWTHCCDTVGEGSVMALDWTTDGTQVVCGTGAGSVAIAQMIDRRVHWGNFTVTLTDSRKIIVQDVLSNSLEELEQRDKVIKLSIGYGYLVVCTSTQCVTYDVQRFNSPSTFDLRDAVITLLQSEKLFLLADCAQGVALFTYEGRPITTIRVAVSIRPEMVSSSLLSLSGDTVAVRDPADAKKITFYEVQTGRPMKDFGVTHHLDIMELQLSQSGTITDRRVAFVDRNRDMYLSGLSAQSGLPQKIATMTSSLRWHAANETLVAISDRRLVTWYLPTVIFIDRDLLSQTKWVRDDGGEEFSPNDQIQEFSSTRVGVRRGSDGALLIYGVSPSPALLFGAVARHDWEAAVRLCRFLDDPTLWSILAALAMKAAELRTAAVGYAALGDMDKVRYVESIKEIPSPEGRQAELALFMRRLDEAERILLQAGLVYRAIDLHMRLYNWERALDIAVERRTHIDTVVARRQHYLETVGRKEGLDKFRQVANSVKVDMEVIEEKVKQELQKERQRPNAKPYQ